MSETIQHPSQLSYLNDVPFVVWCYWEGAQMTGNRLLSFEYLKKNIGVPLCLVTAENIHSFIKNEHPLPKEYSSLSIVHRSDYIRAYLMHHYGGAWHDIKATNVSYADAWIEFENPNIWIIGKPEIEKGAAKVYTTNGAYVPEHYQDLIAVPSWIARPNTPFSKEMLFGLESILQTNSNQLLKYPAKHPREKKLPKGILRKLVAGIKFIYQKRSLNYPLEWTLFGNVFHPLILKHKKNVSYNLPVDTVKNAGVYHRG